MPSSRVLLIGNEVSQAPLVQLLKQQGLLVSNLQDGEQVLEALAADPIALVLVDDELSGLSVCRRLRDSGSEVPIVLISERGDVVDRILGLEMGADDYVVKPFDAAELLARIRVQLRRQARRAQ